MSAKRKPGTPRIVWALMFYGIDEAECFGVVDSQELADKWAASDQLYHFACKFELNEVDWPR